MGDLKSHILGEICRLATKHGRAPGQRLFHSETGIAPHEWSGRFWARWSDALAEAGYGPNAFVSKADPERLLEGVAAVSLELGHVPSVLELDLLRRTRPDTPSSSTVTNHFSRAEMIERLRVLSHSRTEFAALAAILPPADPTGEPASRTFREGWVYLLKSGPHYKIGRSETLERRVREVAIALPEATVLEHAIRTDDPAGIESYWHRRFAEKRVGGEWFKLSRVDVSAFKRRKFQ